MTDEPTNPAWSGNAIEASKPLSRETFRKMVDAMMEEPMRTPIYDEKIYRRTGMLVPIGWRHVANPIRLERPDCRLNDRAHWADLDSL